MGPLTALDIRHQVTVRRTRALPHLGLPTARRGHCDLAALPAPELAEPITRTTNPHVLCVTIGRRLIQLRCPMGYSTGLRLTSDLVRAGVHPLDIVIATIDVQRYLDGGGDSAFLLRDSVDWLFWTIRDQWALDAALGIAEDTP